MGESALISLREGFEAALVVAIVLAFVRRSHEPHLARWVWGGTAAAVAISGVTGVVLHVTTDDLRGAVRARTFAAICLAAGALLTWMIFWMRAHGRALKAHLEHRSASALAQQSALGLAMVAFVAVIREGLETALFLLSTTATSSGSEVVVGTLLGLAVAIVLGALLYQGSRRVNMRRFFQVTGALIVVFAAGLMVKTVLFLQSAGDLGTLNAAVYDLTSVRWLTSETQVGRFLAGIFGWDPRPSVEQVVAYLVYLIPVAWLFFRSGASRRPTGATGAQQPTLEPQPSPSVVTGAS